MLVLAFVQALEIGGVLALLGIGAFLWSDSLRRLHETAPTAFRLLIAVVIGCLAGLFAIILHEDLVPDPIEAAGRPVLVAALLVGIVLVARRLQ